MSAADRHVFNICGTPDVPDSLTIRGYLHDASRIGRRRVARRASHPHGNSLRQDPDPMTSTRSRNAVASLAEIPLGTVSDDLRANLPGPTSDSTAEPTRVQQLRPLSPTAVSAGHRVVRAV